MTVLTMLGKNISTAIQVQTVNGTTALLFLTYPHKTKSAMLTTPAVSTVEISIGAKLVTVGITAA
jgi:hypothetical protein